MDKDHPGISQSPHAPDSPFGLAFCGLRVSAVKRSNKKIGAGMFPAPSGKRKREKSYFVSRMGPGAPNSRRLATGRPTRAA